MLALVPTRYIVHNTLFYTSYIHTLRSLGYMHYAPNAKSWLGPCQNLLQVPAHNDIIAYTDEHLRHLNKAHRILVWLCITARTSSK